jgi:hypothetical protein
MQAQLLCIDVTKLENLAGHQELTHHLAHSFKWHHWQYACFHLNVQKRIFYKLHKKEPILQGSDNDVCCINYINFKSLVLKLRAQCPMQKTGDLNGCPLLHIFLASDFR